MQIPEYEGKGNGISGRYGALQRLRETVLRRARDGSKLTLPYLFPEAGHTESSEYYTPYQSLGSRGVNNLANKLLMALLPPNQPFAKHVLDDFTVMKMAEDPKARAKIEEGLNRVERAIQSKVETLGVRSPVFEGLKQLIIGGNTCLYVPKKGNPRVYNLENYVVVRTRSGDVLEGICKEWVPREQLSTDDIQSLGLENFTESDYSGIGYGEKGLPMYTRYWLADKKYHICQYINNREIPGTKGSFPLDEGPMMFLRWSAIDGEDYGRGLIEEYMGDLMALEGLSKAVLEGSAAAARMVWMVAPNGSTRMKDVAGANNGDVISGNALEVTVLQSQKQADLQVAAGTMQAIEQRLSYVFLLYGGVQRQAERVTAEEVRQVAQELETALGGVYNVMARDFQMPLVKIIMSILAKEEGAKLPKDILKPQIVTGVDALGRGNDLQQYTAFVQALSPFGPELLMQYINPGDFIKRVGTSLGIPMDGLVKDEEQLAAEQAAQQKQMQQAQMMQMAEKLGPAAIKEGGEGLRQMAEQNQQQQQEGG